MPQSWLLICRCTANPQLDSVTKHSLLNDHIRLYTWKLNHNISTWIHENNYTNLIFFSKINQQKYCLPNEEI